jgi:hypothetical protein
MSDAHQELAVYLKRLMKTLEQLGHGHAEIYDTDVREQLFDAVFLSFIKPQAGYVLPDSYGLSDEQGNQSVKAALEQYVTAAKSYAEQVGLNAPLDRLAVFQNPDVFTDNEAQYPDDFFGWMDPADLEE